MTTLLLCRYHDVTVGCEKSIGESGGNGVLQKFCSEGNVFPCPELLKDGCPYLHAKRARKTLHRCELCEVEYEDED